MNNFARTDNNRERLQQKSFFKRHLIVKRLINKLKEYWDYYKWPSSAGSGRCVSPLGNRWNRKRSQTYELRALKCLSYKWGEPYYQTLTKQFNKPQLIGKIISIDGKDFRIISKR